MNDPGTARLIAHFSVKNFGGDILRVADLNNDGRPELLIMQTAGQLSSLIYKDKRNDVDDVDRELYCLTAVDLHGKVLWQDGAPYRRDLPFTCHGGRMLLTDDIDADGRLEIAVIRRNSLAILDARTGQCKQSVALEADNMVSVGSAQLGPQAAGRHLFCKVNDSAYPPWEYGNPTMVFNPDLSVHRAPFAVRGAGHNVLAADINGDGYDEIFIGYSMFDHELNEIWRLDLGPGFDYARHHADHLVLDDVNNDGKLEVLYSGSEDFSVANLEGHILWKTKAGHSQTAVAGNWGPRGETRIIMNEKNRGIWCLDPSGKIVWNRKDMNGYARFNVRWRRAGARADWPLFQPQQKPFASTPHTSDSAASRELWPGFLAADGARLPVFPWRDAYAQPQRTIRAARSYDCGVGYKTITADLDGDGLDEAIISDRDSVWVFHSPE